MTRMGARKRLLGGALAALALVLAPAAVAAAEATQDSELSQTLDPNQAQGSGQVVLDDGHIDFGPTLNTGEWIVQIHDDTAQPSYWRMPEDVALHVNDGSKLTIPDSEAYSFLGLEPGTDAWVIPQVREPGVIWAGWNTQEPNVLDSLSMGTTLSILGVEGPGDISVYLQSGNFGEPEPLWSTQTAFPQDTWIELNTHTHANWVFSEPGVYLVEVQFSGELLDGETVSAHDTLRFAVGDATDPHDAFAAEFDESALPSEEPGATHGSESPDAEDTQETGVDSTGPMGLVLGIVAGAVAAALVVAIVVIVAARAAAKKRARRLAWQRAQENAAASASPAASEKDTERDTAHHTENDTTEETR